MEIVASFETIKKNSEHEKGRPASRNSWFDKTVDIIKILMYGNCLGSNKKFLQPSETIFSRKIKL